MKIRLLMAVLATTLATTMVVASGPLSAQAQQTPSAESIILRASRTWQSLGSFQAEFRQKLDDPLVDHRDSRGMLYQRGPSRFAMRFTDPANSAIVIDGSAVWVYLPEDIPRQVAKWPMPAGPVYNYNLLTWLFDRPLEKYRATWVRQESVDGKPSDVLLLEPLAPNLPFRRATIWIERDSGLPRRIELDEKILTRTVSLSRIRTNGTIPPGTFRFDVPAGVRVVEQ